MVILCAIPDEHEKKTQNEDDDKQLQKRLRISLANQLHYKCKIPRERDRKRDGQRVRETAREKNAKE